MIKIIAYTTGADAVSIGVDACEVAQIRLQKEKKSFQFVADDFSFSMSDGEELYGMVKDLLTVNIIVQNESNGITYFTGTLDFEGCGFDKETDSYSFSCFDKIKSLWSDWSQQLAPIYPRLTWIGTGPDEGYFTNVYSETIIPALKNATGLDVVIPEYDGTRSLLTYLTEVVTDYKTKDLILDCAAHLNCCVYLNNGALTFKKRNSVIASVINVDESLICSYKESLRQAQYSSVLYPAISFRTRNGQYVDPNIYGNFYGVLVNETVDGIDTFSTLPEKFNMGNVLDLRQKLIAGSTSFTREIVFQSNNLTGITGPQSDNAYYLYPHEIFEIGFSELINTIPLDKLGTIGVDGTVEIVTHDLVRESTTVTIERVLS